MASGTATVNTIAPKFKLESYKKILAKQSDEEFQHAALDLIEDQSLKNKDSGKVRVLLKEADRAACVACILINDSAKSGERLPKTNH
jgi:hypothetical protein